MDALRETVAGEIASDPPVGEIDFDLEALLRAHYPRIAGVIARVVRDRARAEELAPAHHQIAGEKSRSCRNRNHRRRTP